jgi:hypothetical protein
MKAIMVCVDYGDLLSLTLPYNKHHFEQMLVVTAPRDRETQNICEREGVLCYLTDSFYSNGAKFNKWLALEEGLDVLGRDGWLCIMDADVLLPKSIKVTPGDNNSLYFMKMNTDIIRSSVWRLADYQLCTPLRHMMIDVSSLSEKGVPSEDTWVNYPLHRNQGEWAGYCQIFHADDKALGNPPWHEVNWRHAGGADSFFQRKWSPDKKIRPPFNVLHLGPPGTNWCGRVTPTLEGITPEESQERIEALKGFINGRRVAKADRFSHEKL